MQLAIKTNVDDVLRDVDEFADDIIAKALPRTLNKVAEQARTAGLRAVAREYGVPPRTFERYVRLIRARERVDFEASIRAKGSGLPLGLFDPVPMPGRGVSVRVKGRRFLVPHAFMATMKSGRRGVFARGSYGGKGMQGRALGAFGRFQFHTGVHRVRPDRVRTALPINELFTFGPAEAWGSEGVTKAMADRVEEQFGKVLKQEMRFLARRA